MQSFRQHLSVGARRVTISCASGARGVALIVALLLLSLMTILGIGMVIAVSSDSLVNGYYGSYRSSYYAADSGLNIVRQQLKAQIISNVSQTACNSWGTGAGTGCTNYPIQNPGSVASSVQNSLLAAYGGTPFLPLNGGATVPTTPGTAYYPGSFKLKSATVTSSSVSNTSSVCTYTFLYSFTTLGKGPGPQQVQTSETGYLTITATANTGQYPANFSQLGAFINSFAANSNPLVPGTMTGPQWTNGSWNFGTSGTYTFTGTVSQSGSTVSYDFPCGGSYCYVDTAAQSASYNRQTIAPNFEGGLNVGLPAAPMPQNDINQQWAVVDGIGSGESGNPPLSQDLENINGTAYSSSSTGVYIPYQASSPTGNPPANTITGGGFYVQGDVTSLTLTPGTDSSGNPTETYTIVQGRNTTTTIVTDLNPSAPTTTVTSGNRTLNLSGVPSNTNTRAFQTLFYVAGNINSLSGPNGESSAAIQNGVQLTIAASGDIDITGNLKYEQEPVTLNAADTCLPANNKGQVLGLFTTAGNIGLNSPYNDNNLEIDGAIAAVGGTCTQNSMQSSCGLQTNGSINTLTIVGGRSEANAHAVSINQSNTYYDCRFVPGTSNSIAPPFFPSTTLSTGKAGAPTVTATVSRLNWYQSYH